MGLVTIFRDSPLTPQRYWIDLVNPTMAEHWAIYVSAMGRDKLRVISTVHHDSEGSTPARDWVLFDVIRPVIYNHNYLPSPTVGNEVTSEGDTVTRPDPAPSLELPTIGSITSGVGTAVTAVAVVACVAVAVALATVVALKINARRD